MQSTSRRPASAARMACLLLRHCSYYNRSHAKDAFEGDHRCCRVLLDKVNQRCACSLALRVPELCTCMQPGQPGACASQDTPRVAQPPVTPGTRAWLPWLHNACKVPAHAPGARQLAHRA